MEYTDLCIYVECTKYDGTQKRHIGTFHSMLNYDTVYEFDADTGHFSDGGYVVTEIHETGCYFHDNSVVGEHLYYVELAKIRG